MLLKNIHKTQNIYPAAVVPKSAGYFIESINDQNFDQPSKKDCEKDREEIREEIIHQVCPTGFFHF